MSFHRLRLGDVIVGLTVLLAACDEGEPQTVDQIPRDGGEGPNIEVPVGGDDAALLSDARANGTVDEGTLPNARDGGASSDARDAQAGAGDGSELDPGAADAQVGGHDAAQDGGSAAPAADGGLPPANDGGEPPAPDTGMPPPPDSGMPPPPDGGMRPTT